MEKNCCNIDDVHKAIAAIFKELEGVKDPAKLNALHARAFKHFTILTSEDRQTYLKREGADCIKFIDHIWQRALMDWLSKEVCATEERLERLDNDERLYALKEVSEIGSWFVGIKMDLIAAEKTGDIQD